MSRIASTFAALREQHRLALIAYLTVGFPRLDQTAELVRTAAASGADLIELGIPFSDPLADGRTIQAASHQALGNGVTVARALEAAAAARRLTPVPILFMTYVNPVLAYGLSAFCDAAAAAGIDGLIVPDLPPAEAGDLRRSAGAAGLGLVFFVAPTSSPAAIAAACEASTAFVYCVALTGVTGARQSLDPAVIPLIASVRRMTALPIVVGFGLSRAEHLQALEGEADGAIIASALLDAIGQAPDDAPGQVARFLEPLRRHPRR
ncbi:MAG: tryptophan synthase subunit alpha [Candidatus Dormibacteraeota bacterium]|nr:tryptophan synthase subunit alpha [Candidatus Dormibacteraeota bacterium]